MDAPTFIEKKQMWNIQTWVKLNDLPISSGGDINKTIKKQLIQDQNNKV
jgi:hypothetical protein